MKFMGVRKSTKLLKELTVKKPRNYRKGWSQHADCQDAFKIDGSTKELPKAVYIACEEMTAKDVWKLIDWLYEAGKWMEDGK